MGSMSCRAGWVQGNLDAMDLYISPLSGSLAVHIAALEAGLQPRIYRVDRKTKQLDDGRDFRAISPLGIVPVISLPDGGVLTESVAILQYIADQVPEKRLAPPAGTLERYRLQERLNFTTSELHKRHIWPVFSGSVTPEMKLWSRANVGPRLEHVARHLESRDYVLERFSVADCYLFWTLFVAPHGGISLDAYQPLR